MKRTLLILVISSISLFFIWVGIRLVQSKEGELNIKQFIGKEAYKDKFPLLVGEIDESKIAYLDNVLGASYDEDLIYKKHLIELPLVRGDYYYGKHINATAAVNEINQIRILKAGDRISIIGNGYLTMSSKRGYVNPGSGFLYASGACWASSTLGTLMDEVNKAFGQKYQKPLFTFYAGDRTPHPASYATYKDSNYGRGYTVVMIPHGSSTDYRFTVNPTLKTDSRFQDLKIKIVMISRTDNAQAFLGQSIGGYILSNIDF